MAAALHLRMLGPLSVSREDRALQLPASRKVRALLAYLALAPRATPRQRLCSLLWHTAIDPRGELRWALSKLRAVIGSDRLDSREDSVRLELDESCVDALVVERAAQAGFRPERARELLALYDGELLDGLDVAGCPGFASWLLAQRQRFQSWRLALLELAPADIHIHERPQRAEAEQAYDCYLQGRQHLSRMMRRGLLASRKMFGRALELDPRYGPAWAGLTIAHACLHEWFDTSTVSLARAEHASRRALEAAPRLAEAHVARGFARSLSRHYDEAIDQFEQAIHLNPELFDAYYYFARTAFARGDMRRAAELFALAAQLRPEDFQSPMLLAIAARALGREGAAWDAVRTGVRRAEQVLALNPHDGRALSLGAGVLVDAGQTERALEWSRRCLEHYPDDTSALVNIACVHARAGQKTEALDLLERVFAQGCGKRDWVMNDPDYSSLRDEPRFTRMLAQLR